MQQPPESPSDGRTRIGRRTFLTGAAAAGLLAACSGDDDAESPADGAGSELAPDTFILVQRFPNTVLVPGEVRLPHSLTRDAAFVNDGPDELGAYVADIDGNQISDRMVAPRFDVSPSSYYVWRPTIDEPGIYSLVVDGGPATGASFQVFDPSEVAVPLPGQLLAGFDTPTVGEPAGVDPICTRDPMCPFHSVTLTEALNVDRAVAYLVGTPAFCQTGTCAPALEALIEVEPEFGDDFVFVHAEVFTDLTAQDYTEAVLASGLSFEPALFITDRAGEIVDRLDAIWSADELRERLALANA
ncbi:twin-arginine translocation signal domain-containing protein [Ilumatobacter coccineus]|jgi:hypothetical protein|uniref:Thioredoxin domain-containing protein n=1 Tax=Ilumatobacter coccineus (strain NBRC 103263 / KCTC 29153 / YM16-304) TaxID=1313172 RepID=A0A6C7EBP1_ILUCY|nr:twin-arginine translocation signal domain-containing protein [Ilumatobacter coccineus]BAN04157.1 hypothetical protein YM304_38430 [Ilumatobacter coccineus YM16-304]